MQHHRRSTPPPRLQFPRELEASEHVATASGPRCHVMSVCALELRVIRTAQIYVAHFPGWEVVVTVDGQPRVLAIPDAEEGKAYPVDFCWCVRRDPPSTAGLGYGGQSVSVSVGGSGLVGISSNPPPLPTQTDTWYTSEAWGVGGTRTVRASSEGFEYELDYQIKCAPRSYHTFSNVELASVREAQGSPLKRMFDAMSQFTPLFEAHCVEFVAATEDEVVLRAPEGLQEILDLLRKKPTDTPG